MVAPGKLGPALAAALLLGCAGVPAPVRVVERASPPAIVEHDDEHEHEHEHEHAEDLLEIDDAALAALVATDAASLGSLSIGKPNAGALVNAVRMPEGEHWQLVAPQRAFATAETVGYLAHALTRLHEQFPAAHPIYIGHLSREQGGPIRPHRSHQSGRDADISYCYKPEKAAWYQKAGARTLDLPCSWALIRTLVTETDVEYIFVERYVQKLLREHAESIGEDRAWLDRVFQYGSKEREPLVRHAWGHATHVHVRFYNPRAQALGARTFDALVSRGLVKPGNWLHPVAAVVPERRLPAQQRGATTANASAAAER